MIWVTNGKICKRIDESVFQDYQNKGFIRGKKLDSQVIVPWNKGLTASTDERVAKYVKNKPKTYTKSIHLSMGQEIVFENGYTVQYTDQIYLIDTDNKYWKVTAKKCD